MGAVTQSSGHAVVAGEKDAEYVLINTCTVTPEADRNSRK